MPRVQNKRGTAANLTSVDPTPLAGELLVVTDENTLKIGNGTDAYTSLAYVTATPRSHKSTHATGGSDALTPSDIGAAPAASPTFTGTVTISSASTLGDSAARAGLTSRSGTAVLTTPDFNAGKGVLVSLPTAAGWAGRIRVYASRVAGSGGLGAVGEFAVQRPNGDLHVISARGGDSIGGCIFYHDSATDTPYMRLRVAGFRFLVVTELTVTDAWTIAVDDGSPPSGTEVKPKHALVDDAGDLSVAIDGTEQLAVSSSGLDVNGVITVSAGSAAAPALVSGTGTSDSGIYWPAADTVAISTAGVERVRVDSSGRVGVNDPDPSYRLSVIDGVGQGYFSGGVWYARHTGNGDSGFVLARDTSNMWSLQNDYSEGDDLYVRAGGFSGSPRLVIERGSGGSERLTIRSTGAVRFVPLAADPASGNEAGDVYYNSSTNKLRVYNGTSWVDLH